MRKIIKILAGSTVPAFFVVLAIIIAKANYEPGTFLSGWDTLHPEFDYSLYVKRMLFGVWQEHQGVGAVASQAHPAELTRMLLFSPLSILLPVYLLRYVFYFITLIIGVLGVYYLGMGFFENRKIAKVTSVLGALYYLFNLSTLQQYYVPLEMFAVYFAVIPWFFLTAVKYLRDKTKLNLLLFLITAVFSSSMAHTPTLFYVFSGLFIGFLIVRSILVFKIGNFIRSVLLILILFSVNLYWILPNTYFLRNHANEVEMSKIHTDFTPEAFYQSQNYGDIDDIVLQKNFLFNWREYNFDESKFVNLMDEWMPFVDSNEYKVVSYALLGLAGLGFLFSLLKGNKNMLAMSTVFGVSLLFLIKQNPPFSDLFIYLRDKFPLLKEGLRFPFTKFSFTYTLPISLFISSVFYYPLDFFSRRRVKTLKFFASTSLYILLVCVLLSISFLGLPFFKGNLVSPSMKVSIPPAYFEMFDYFKNIPNDKRIAKFPVQNQWGWVFYDWGYQGAGFTWFGLKQPTMDREFNRWSPYNETFYNEISNVLYQYQLISPGKYSEENIDLISKNNKEVVTQFEKTLDKYDISYLLLDESVLNAGGDPDILFRDEFKDLAEKSEKISLVEKFDFLDIYKVEENKTNQFLSVPETITFVNSNPIYSVTDPVYAKYGDYLQKENEIGYPFVNFDERSGVTIKVNEAEDEIEFENPNLKVSATFPITEMTTESFSSEQGFSQGYNCDLEKLGSVGKEHTEKGNIYTATDNGVSCDYYFYPKIDRSKSYILRIKGVNTKGRSLKIYLYNPKTGKIDLESLLPEKEFDEYFLINQKEPQLALQNGENPTLGYTLNVETRSFGKIASENRIEKIEFIPIDLNWFYQIKTKDTSNFVLNNIKLTNIRKLSPTNYLFTADRVNQVSNLDGVVVLSQGYEDGWVAYALDNNKKTTGNLIKGYFPMFIGKRMEHVKVNGWENGWYLPSDRFETEVVIIFWPQYLEWVGFILLILIIALITFYTSRRKKTSE